MDDFDSRLGRLMQRLSEEFDRLKLDLDDAGAAARAMDAYIDGILPEYRLDGSLSKVLRDAKGKYRDFARRA